MSERHFLKSLGLAGFRAYLTPTAFDFSKKRSLAIFAPNGSGKSSLIDALEFILSKDGTLERLGLKAIHNQAGPTALVHNLSIEKKIEAKVMIEIVAGQFVTEGSRSATGKRTIPDAVNNLNPLFTVPPIIRGYSLREFVDNHKPEQRYSDVANWLQLGPLVEVQKNIRLLRTQVKATADDEGALNRVDAQLAKETSQAINNWNAAAVLSHANMLVLAPLDKALALTNLTEFDPAYVELEVRAKAEEDKIGLAGLQQIQSAATALWNSTTDTETDEVIIGGSIHIFDSAVASLALAEDKEAKERDKAAGAVFQRNAPSRRGMVAWYLSRLRR